MPKKVIIGVFLIISVASFVMIYHVMIYQKIGQYEHHLYIKSEDIYDSLEDGDILYRMGNRVWSLLFRDTSPTERRFSHVGIVRIRNGHVTVISAEALTAGGDFVKEVSLNDYLWHTISAGLYRVNNIDGALISDTAIEFLGRPFDWDFDMEEDEKLYCSELLYVVLKKIDPNIKLNTFWDGKAGKYVIPMDVYLQKEYFTEIGSWGK